MLTWPSVRRNLVDSPLVKLLWLFMKSMSVYLLKQRLVSVSLKTGWVFWASCTVRKLACCLVTIFLLGYDFKHGLQNIGWEFKAHLFVKVKRGHDHSASGNCNQYSGCWPDCSLNTRGFSISVHRQISVPIVLLHTVQPCLQWSLVWCMWWLIIKSHFQCTNIYNPG